MWTISPGVPFARALAAEILRRAGDDPAALPHWRILLPTRRACRAVREAFLRESGGRPLLLPRLQPLGDVDDEELDIESATLGAATDLDIPPAMPPLRRRVLLAQAVRQSSRDPVAPAHALALANALGRLMDRIHTEGLSLAALPGLVGDEFAEHWQVTLDFLKTLSVVWPEILTSHGMIDAADRRNRLLRAQAAHWAAYPPQTPVIAAGTTGSIPATATLLKAVADLPHGMIVLPGLDTAMDEDSWTALDDTHPQATLKRLLATLGVKRENVASWPAAKTPGPARQKLVTEVMRPAATAAAWAALEPANIPDNISLCEAETPQEEARVIAVLLREALETPEQTAALITPDRRLARRVAALCRRWGIALDDSGGTPLAGTPRGGFLRLTAQAHAAAMTPTALLSLLRHDLCGIADTNAIGTLEKAALRGAKPPPGIAGLRNRLEHDNALIDSLEAAVAPLTALTEKTAPFTAWIDAHVAAAENLAGGADNLWRGDDGAAASLFFSDLREHATALPDCGAGDYLAALEELMKPVTVRSPHGAHPRLAILGQLEARLVQADLVICGGLNEKSWPPDPGHDPWMSRPMMKQFGLPSPERAIGLAAHDFAQAFCAPRVVLTRSKKMDGAPAVPARWLQRLDTVLAAQKADPAALRARAAPGLDRARALDKSVAKFEPRRPAPAPPVAIRPRKLSVTEIDTWLRDPYAIYAKHVLRLRKLEPLEKQPSAADRGDLLHGVLHDFITAHKTTLPPDPAAVLRDIGRDRLARRADDPGFWDFWWPRFVRITDWMAQHERDWRAAGNTPAETEIAGKMTIPGPAGDFVLTVRADRIDRRADGTYAAIDYKSGGQYTKTAIENGNKPQLALEGLILAAGGFEGLEARPPGWLGYWVLTGGNPAGDDKKFITDSCAAALEAADAGLAALVAAFDDPATPYYSLPDPDRAPDFNDYLHLARVQEWADLDDTEAAA